MRPMANRSMPSRMVTLLSTTSPRINFSSASAADTGCENS
jgi:hypothetical protein